MWWCCYAWCAQIPPGNSCVQAALARSGQMTAANLGNHGALARPATTEHVLVMSTAPPPPASRNRGEGGGVARGYGGMQRSRGYTTVNGGYTAYPKRIHKVTGVYSMPKGYTYTQPIHIYAHQLSRQVRSDLYQVFVSDHQIEQVKTSHHVASSPRAAVWQWRMLQRTWRAPRTPHGWLIIQHAFLT